jgi:hypothetical protein
MTSLVIEVCKSFDALTKCTIHVCREIFCRNSKIIALTKYANNQKRKIVKNTTQQQLKRIKGKIN